MERTYAVLNQGGPVEFVTSKLNELEGRRIDLGRDINVKSAEQQDLLSRETRYRHSKEEIKQLVDRLQSPANEELFKLRAQIASQLKVLTHGPSPLDKTADRSMASVDPIPPRSSQMRRHETRNDRRERIEQVIGRLAESTGRDRPLVIKWMATPTNAFDHLSRLGLDALLDMGTASFWRGSQPSVTRDVEGFDHAFEARMMANELLGVRARPDSENSGEVQGDG